MKGKQDFEYKQISTKEIIVNDKAQRDVNKRDAQFRKIMKSFDPMLVNQIKVALISGRYYCFDGQMTMKVLKARNGGRDLMVDCKVYYGMTDLDAARMFVNQNGTVSRVGAVDKLRVQYNYGEDNVVNFVRLTEMNGVTIDWTNSQGKNKVVAINTLYNVFNSFSDPKDYSQFLQILRDSWGGEPDSFRNEIMNGLHIFMKAYSGAYSAKSLSKKLSAVSPKSIIREAKLSTAYGDRKYAVQIMNVYNKGASTNRLPDLP